jgi:predicted enzyme related to lactoylglutathione lyase
MSEDFGLDTVGQVFMPVRDLERAITFYRDVLGMAFLFEVPHMAFFELEGLRLMLGAREDGTEHPGSILYYKVSDLGAAHAILRERGVTFALDPTLIADMEDHELWMSFFNDTEGNQLALMSEVAKADPEAVSGGHNP